MNYYLLVVLLVLLMLFACGEEEKIEGPFCEDLDGVCLPACPQGSQPSLLDCKDATLTCCVNKVIG